MKENDEEGRRQPGDVNRTVTCGLDADTDGFRDGG